MRVVIAEDEFLFRAGMRRLLEDRGFEVVAEAADAPDLLRKVAGHKPELVVTDVRMPPGEGEDGLRAAVSIRSRLPETNVLVLSHYIAERGALELVGERAEGVGYLLKDRIADLDHFVESLRRVAAGGSALDPLLVSRLLGRRPEHPVDRLTPREREVLALMAEGRSNRGIAGVLVVTETAVEKHVRNILSKLDIGQVAEDHRRVRAVLRYLERGADAAAR